jgi:cysteine-S-conjugate beta-lyase
MTARPGLKWNYYGPDVLPAWVAEMDFGLAPAIADALHDAIDRADTGYPYPAIERAVSEAATGFWETRFGWAVDPDRVFHAPDVIEGIRRAIIHLTRPGTQVVLHTPVYFPFFSMVERAGRQIVEVPSMRGPDGRYRLDLEGIEAALAAGAGCVVLCNPWNPVGRTLSSDEVESVITVAARHHARVIVDEVHAPLIFDGSPHVVGAVMDPGVVVTVTAASKAWNIPGLKAAQVVLTNDDDAEVWSTYFTPEKVGVGSLGLIGSAAAYAKGGDWLDEVMTTLHANRALLTELIAKHLPSVGYVPPEATYLAWLECSEMGWGDPAEHCLTNAGVAVTDGALFRGDGAGHVRLNFATQPETLVEIVERMAGSVGR